MRLPHGYETSFGPDAPDSRTNRDEPARFSQTNVPCADLDESRTPPALALAPDILERFRTDLRRAGVAGEETLSTLVYLCLTSRLLPWGKPTERPVSVLPKGASSSGKSHATKTTLRFFPPSAYIDIGSMSRRFLFYTEAEFSHRFIYVPEWASIKDDEELVALLRVLVSEGRVVHGTVDKNREAHLIEKDGPTGLLMTTTDASVDSELETRCLSILTDDSRDQTRRVFRVLAELEDQISLPVDFDSWCALQEWLANRDARVMIPFAHVLAELMPTTAIRLRRDFPALLSLVRSHALLHQAQRETDSSGRIVATVEHDYAAVRDLVSDLIAEGVEAGVSEAMRETVRAVRDLTQETEAAYVSSMKDISARLNVGRSATYDRVRRALMAGYLVDLATREERGMKLAPGSVLPSGDDYLPSVHEIVRASSDDPSGLANRGARHEPAQSSGCPVRPATDDPVQADPDYYRTVLVRPPLVGDDGYLPWLFERFGRELLTGREWQRFSRAHELLVGPAA